jgi:hypothetical protein
MLIRGIDGASIEPGAWCFLQQRFPRLRIILAFSCTEDFVRSREPDDVQYFYRTDPYDERLYGLFPLDQLVSSLTRMSQNLKYLWLENEWRLGKVYRNVLSMAFQADDQDDISQAQFQSLHTQGRNDLPIVEG